MHCSCAPFKYVTTDSAKGFLVYGRRLRHQCNKLWSASPGGHCHSVQHCRRLGIQGILIVSEPSVMNLLLSCITAGNQASCMSYKVLRIRNTSNEHMRHEPYFSHANAHLLGMPRPCMLSGTVAFALQSPRHQPMLVDQSQELSVQRCSCPAVVNNVMAEQVRRKDLRCCLTLLLARCGVGAAEPEVLGLTAFLCFTGAEAGRLLPAGTNTLTSIQTCCCRNILIESQLGNSACVLSTTMGSNTQQCALLAAIVAGCKMLCSCC